MRQVKLSEIKYHPLAGPKPSAHDPSGLIFLPVSPGPEAGRRYII